MRLPRKYNVGDIVERLPSKDPYDLYNKEVRKYGRLTFIIVEVDEKYIRSLDKIYIVYKVICMQSEETYYLSFREKDGWRKIS